jgi:hypothetical protein
VVIALLNPRVWIGLVIAAALIFSHFFVYRAGANNVRLEWKSATAAANAEASKMEALRRSRVDEGLRAAAPRQVRIRTESAGVGDAVVRLRDSIAARRLAEESAAAATQRANSLGVLLVESAGAYRELAETCDRHVSDLRLLLESWPR